MESMSIDFESQDLPDADVIAAVQGGDVEAYGKLVERHLDSIRLFLSLKVPSEALTDRLAQEAFVFAFRNIAAFTLGTSFRSWLRAIAWNLLRAEVQRHIRGKETPRSLEDRTFLLAATRENYAHDSERLETCLYHITAPLRSLMELKYKDGLTSEQIAARFRRTAPWVRSTLFRIRKQLQNCIENRNEDTDP